MTRELSITMMKPDLIFVYISRETGALGIKVKKTCKPL